MGAERVETSVWPRSEAGHSWDTFGVGFGRWHWALLVAAAAPAAPSTAVVGVDLVEELADAVFTRIDPGKGDLGKEGKDPAPKGGVVEEKGNFVGKGEPVRGRGKPWVQIEGILATEMSQCRPVNRKEGLCGDLETLGVNDEGAEGLQEGRDVVREARFPVVTDQAGHKGFEEASRCLDQGP